MSVHIKTISVVIVVSAATVFLSGGKDNLEDQSSNGLAVEPINDTENFDKGLTKPKQSEDLSQKAPMLSDQISSRSLITDHKDAISQYLIRRKEAFSQENVLILEALEDENLDDVPIYGNNIEFSAVGEHAEHDSVEADLPGFEDVDYKFGVAENNYREPDGLIDDAPALSNSLNAVSIDELAEHDSKEADLTGFEDINFKFGLVEGNDRQPDGYIDDVPNKAY